MNIIISEDKAVRATQATAESYDIKNLVFYIANTLSYSDIYLNLKKNRNTYSFILERVGETKNYYVYEVIFTQPVALTEREYDLTVNIDAEELEIGSYVIQAIEVTAPITRTFNLSRSAGLTIGPFGLTDMHEPVDIKDRNILFSNNQNVILAEDNISQSITFRMPRFYDGIDLASKSLFFDYIDLETEELKNLSLAKEYILTDIYLDGDPVEYMTVAWAVPYEVTKKAGKVKFALSAIDLTSLTPDEATGDVRQYIWQTNGATLEIKPNLHKRNEIPINDVQSTALEDLISEIDAIKSSDIYNADASDPQDGEVLLTCGGATPDEEE